MKILRTPEHRFEDLPEYPFEAHYVEIADERFGNLRMHYLDEGPRNGPLVVMLHGQGCWSYIFRKMIPALADAGLRVICPDYIGFGKSDKLPRAEDYEFNDHIGWITAFLETMNIRGATAYLFDWGCFFGLRIAAEHPEFFDRIALSNGNLPMGDGGGTAWFINWRTEQFALPEFPQGEMVNDGTRVELSPELIAAYDAPYPDESFKTGPRRFPMILPITPDMGGIAENRAAWQTLGDWKRPVLALFSADFKGTSMGPERMLEHIPGCQGQPHEFIEDAGFYIVEDQSGKLAQRLIGFAS